MRTSPKTSCEVQYYNQAMSEMRIAMSRAGNAWYAAMGIDPNNPPPWVESAVRQHALFYAIERCRAAQAQRMNGAVGLGKY